MLSLAEAIRTDCLAEFISQQEAAGVGPANRAALEAALTTLAKATQPEDQTSHSPSGDGSTGKKTRRGSGPCASD